MANDPRGKQAPKTVSRLEQAVQRQRESQEATREAARRLYEQDRKAPTPEEPPRPS